MIIGLSGKKSHGKDTVAKIIQFLLFEKNYAEGKLQFFSTNRNAKLEVFLEWEQGQRDEYSGFTKKMWAEKLKQVVCLLIGCTMEQLEDQAFKEKPLGDEWVVWYLVNGRDETQIISPLYATEQELRANLNEVQQRELLVDGVIVHGERLTPRKLLQLIGTEGGRNIVHPNIWVNATMVDYTSHISDMTDGFPNWIITDTRFRNECRAIKQKGGLLIRVVRPGIETVSTHESEIALDNVPIQMWDGYITNTGKRWLEILFEQTKAILIKHKLL